MLSSRKQQLRFDTAVALVIATAMSYFALDSDVFEHWYYFTRQHEIWQLDDLTIVFFIFALAAMVVAIRHTVELSRLTKELDVAQKALRTEVEVKNRREKMAALGQMASGLAHEINNALQPVVGLGPFVKEGLRHSGNKKHFEYMEIIDNSAQYARRVIENVLAYAHDSPDSLERHNAYAVLDEAIRFCTNLLPSSIVLETTLTAAMQSIAIDGDKTGIIQIMINILKNAAQAMNDKGVIRITGTYSLAGQHRIAFAEENAHLAAMDVILVKIADSGHGMNAETLKRIFDPFFTTKELQQGTGLGLSTVYGVMKKHGGAVTAASILGKGSIFTLVFPVAAIKEKQYHAG